MRWYAVYTQAGSELWARSNLWERGIEVYLPRYLRLRRHARRTDWIAAPLFPRYLFVRTDLGGGEHKSIGTAPGVVRLLCTGEAPSPVADEIIAEIRGREGEDELVKLNEAAAWRPGEKVRIVSGALSECVGLFERIDDRQRVFVLLNLLGRGVRVQVAANGVAREG